MASRGYVCLLVVLLAAGSVRALEDKSENKVTPLEEKDDGGRFFFSTTSTGTSSSSTSPVLTLTLGVGDILFAVLAVALCVAAGVVIAGIFFDDSVGTSGYSAPSSYESEHHHTAESSYAVLRSLEAAARKHE
ncbi:uncharacterized protein LOC127001545 [Eriocheir sinensis]|uniref:uncharacterized protein LOC127001545 n=1 Tax=Eriocheir sinensis TaxID=95602 RepID=UPI0021C88289|nr:uncharacterized protein LOC127001545 [Eriocheir sinensis]